MLLSGNKSWIKACIISFWGTTYSYKHSTPSSTQQAPTEVLRANKAQNVWIVMLNQRLSVKDVDLPFYFRVGSWCTSRWIVKCWEISRNFLVTWLITTQHDILWYTWLIICILAISDNVQQSSLSHSMTGAGRIYAWIRVWTHEGHSTVQTPQNRLITTHCTHDEIITPL